MTGKQTKLVRTFPLSALLECEPGQTRIAAVRQVAQDALHLSFAANGFNTSLLVYLHNGSPVIIDGRQRKLALESYPAWLKGHEGREDAVQIDTENIPCRVVTVRDQTDVVRQRIDANREAYDGSNTVAQCEAVYEHVMSLPIYYSDQHPHGADFVPEAKQKANTFHAGSFLPLAAGKTASAKVQDAVKAVKDQHAALVDALPEDHTVTTWSKAGVANAIGFSPKKVQRAMAFLKADATGEFDLTMLDRVSSVADAAKMLTVSIGATKGDTPVDSVRDAIISKFDELSRANVKQARADESNHTFVDAENVRLKTKAIVDAIRNDNADSVIVSKAVALELTIEALAAKVIEILHRQEWTIKDWTKAIKAAKAAQK